MSKIIFKNILLFCVVGAMVSAFTTVRATAQVFTPGMVSYWKLDEGSGTMAYDSVGDNHGTIYGATWTPGMVGNALSFDGIDDYVEVLDSPSLDINDQITIEVWVYPFSDVTVGPPRIVSKGGEGPRVGYELTWDWGNKFALVLWEPYRPLFGPPYSKNQWYHVVGTFDGSTQKLYVNGELVGQQTVPAGIPVNDFNLFIGRAEGGYGWPTCYFDGIIDEVAIYNRPLAAEEIQQHYQNGLSGLGYYVIELLPFADLSFTLVNITFQEGVNKDDVGIGGEFTLGEFNDGIDPLNEDVVVTVGTYRLTIPAGSFNETGPGVFRFVGTINNAPVNMRIRALDVDIFSFKLTVRDVDLTGTANPVDIKLRVGDDMGETSIRLKGLLRV